MRVLFFVKVSLRHVKLTATSFTLPKKILKLSNILRKLLSSMIKTSILDCDTQFYISSLHPNKYISQYK